MIFKNTNVLNLLFIFISINALIAQVELKKLNSVDTLELKNVSKDTILDKKQNKNSINSKIVYSAKDSIVFDNVKNKILLYNSSIVEYDEFKVNSFFVEYDWKSYLLKALGRQKKDSIEGEPLIYQNESVFKTKEANYNLKTKKGLVLNVLTKIEEGILHGNKVLKDSTNNWYIDDAKFTTCDHEEPHFYFKSKKMKLIPNKSIITGPTNLVINGVKTPLVLPFGIFPVNKNRRSGLILPNDYGNSRVFFMKGLGFYWGISDYFDNQTTVDIWFNGSYGISNTFRYSKRYKFDGTLSISTRKVYADNVDVDNPQDVLNTPTSYEFIWTHSQDAKSHPTINFNTSVNFITNKYHNNVLNNDFRGINGTTFSNINIKKRFRNSNSNLNLSLNINQYLTDKSISGDFPSLQYNYNGNLFKKKNSLSTNYFNNVNVNFNSHFSSYIKSYDSLLFKDEFFDNLNYGISNNLNFSLPSIKLLKYLNLNQSLYYNNYIYFYRNEFQYKDSSWSEYRKYGIFPISSFGASLGLNTTIIGIKQFKKGALKGIKHQLTPSLNYNFSPDFTKDFWGYYTTIDTGNEFRYSYYSKNRFGSANSSQSSSLTFGLNNFVEIKYLGAKDTSNLPKKIRIIDNLGFSGNYNFANDSFKLSDLFLNFNTSVTNFFRISSSMVLDPYFYDYTGRRVDKLLITNNLGLFRNKSFTFYTNFSLNNNTFKSKKDTTKIKDTITTNYYYSLDNPWTLDFGFNFNTTNNIISNTNSNFINFDMKMDFYITKLWKANITTGYNVSDKIVNMTKITAIRDMHCWELRFNYTPISIYGQSYSIEIRPKAKLLQDLKIIKDKYPSIY